MSPEIHYFLRKAEKISFHPFKFKSCNSIVISNIRHNGTHGERALFNIHNIQITITLFMYRDMQFHSVKSHRQGAVCVVCEKNIDFLKVDCQIKCEGIWRRQGRKLYQDQALFSWFHCASNLRWKKCHCCSISCIFPIELSSLSRLRNWSLECDAILSHKSSAFLLLYFNLIKIHFRVTEFSRVSAVFQLFMMQISTNSKFSMITFQIWVQSKDEENNELKMRLNDT